MKPYERFAAWRVAHEVALQVYRLSSAWPTHERYGLASQARRAAFSVPAHLVEGSARRGAGEFLRFLDIARGSHAELSYALRLARDVGYLSQSDWEAVDGPQERAGWLLWRLYDALRRSERNRPGPSASVRPARRAGPLPSAR